MFEKAVRKQMMNIYIFLLKWKGDERRRHERIGMTMERRRQGSISLYSS